MPMRARLLLVIVVALGPAAAASAASAPSAPIPQEPRALARALEATTRELDAAIARWRPGAAPPPPAVTLAALDEQRIYRLLGRRRALAAGVLAALPPPLRAEAGDVVAARVDLERLATPAPRTRIRVGPARPAAALLGWYRSAERRFGVPWH